MPARCWRIIIYLSVNFVLLVIIRITAIRRLEPSLAAASEAGPTLVGGIACSVDSSGEVTIVLLIHLKNIIII